MNQPTRAITIHATVQEVWRWVVQIGADRRGFYSYDWLENLFGLGIHSASHVVPEWQERLKWVFGWSFAAMPWPDGATRLIVRERTGFDSILTRVLLSPAGWVSFVMTRKMLLGIKARAEGLGRGRRGAVRSSR